MDLEITIPSRFTNTGDGYIKIHAHEWHNLIDEIRGHNTKLREAETIHSNLNLMWSRDVHNPKLSALLFNVQPTDSYKKLVEDIAEVGRKTEVESISEHDFWGRAKRLVDNESGR